MIQTDKTYLGDERLRVVKDSGNNQLAAVPGLGVRAGALSVGAENKGARGQCEGEGPVLALHPGLHISCMDLTRELQVQVDRRGGNNGDEINEEETSG